MKILQKIALVTLLVVPFFVSAEVDPVINYFQVPAEDVNILHPGERAKIYGTNVDSTYKAVLRSGDVTKTATITSYYGTNEFVVPNLNTGTYEAYIEKAGTQSNKISVNVVSSEYFPVAALEVTPTSAGFTYTAQKLSNEQREAQIVQIQTLLMQLIQQLIQLLQQQATTGN